MIFNEIMSTQKVTIDFIIDQLSELNGVYARKMFGEYALYYEAKVVALVCNDNLYVKLTDAGKRHVGKNYKEGYAYPGAKASMLIDGDLIENHRWLSQLLIVTADNLALPKKKKK